MKKLMKKAMKQTAGKNGRAELQRMPLECRPASVIVFFTVNPYVDGLVDVLGMVFPVTDADPRLN